MTELINISPIMQRLYARALEKMEVQQLYLDPSLDLGKLVKTLGTNRTLLSSTLKSMNGVNFSKWISTYRVNHLIGLLQANPDKDPDDLYRLSGFASRTSFYRQFREVTGKTPKEYLLTL